MNKLTLTLKSLLVFLCLCLLILPVLSSGAQEVLVRFSPFHRRITLNLGEVMLLFAAYGGLVVIGAALVDRASLTGENRRLKKELQRSRAELAQLRQMLSVERETE